MGREIRRVPKGWEHPRYPEGQWAGQYRPLYDQDFESAVAEWKREFADWEAGTHPDLESGKRANCLEYWEWNGNPPDRDYYRPKWAEEPTCYQVYQNVTEGTPVSPVFETEEEMRLWLMAQGHSEHAAREFIRHGSAFSMVIAATSDGFQTVAMGIDAYDLP